jgi:hypothetical protein
MVEFSDSPPAVTFRTTVDALGRALAQSSKIRDIVISDAEEATSAVHQLLRTNGINQVRAKNFAFQVDGKCRIDGDHCLVTVKAKFGHHPEDAAQSKEAAKTFEEVVKMLQGVLDSAS